MPYEQSDPRSQLSTLPPANRPTGRCFAPQYFEISHLEPDEVTNLGTRTWYLRSESCVVAYAEVVAGDHLARVDQPDEYMALFPDESAGALLDAGGDTGAVAGAAVVVLPPGASDIELTQPGTVVRLFSNQSPDLLARCRNAAAYDEHDPNVTPFQPWPDPPDGFRIRVYPLAAIEPEPGRFGRLLRCTTLMVNYFYPDPGARDPSKLSPHHHEDFEQLSLQLEGDYVHHIRTPWTVDLAEWRDDDHQRCASPAVTVIPPPTIHTSQAVDDVRHQLIDIFCPPRVDFSLRPGWVLNHDEYPMP